MLLELFRWLEQLHNVCGLFGVLGRIEVVHAA
jgi:hypothetical protein